MRAVTIGMTVHATDGTAGRVDDVLTNGESGQPRLLVVEAGFFRGDVVVGYERVRDVDDAGVHLTLTRDEVRQAPAYAASEHGTGAGLRSQAAARFGPGRDGEG